MAIRINPNHQLLWRDTTTLQLGVGRAAVTLPNLSAAEERFIDALYFGLPADAVAHTASHLHVSEERRGQIIGAIGGLLMKTPEAEPEPGDYALVAAAEMTRASLDNRADPRVVLAARRQKTVFIDKLDATGLTLLLALAAAGVGTVVSRDTGKVTQEDAASNLYPRALVGRLRLPAARLILDSSWPGTKLVNYSKLGDRRTIPYHLAMLTAQQVTSPAEVAAWRTNSVPVLEIRFQPDGAEISPVLDGTDGCLVCRDHREQDADEAHIAVASQLLGAGLNFDDAGTRLVACGLAVGSALEFLDTGRAANAYRYTRQSDTVVATTGWGAHPACGCSLPIALAAAG